MTTTDLTTQLQWIDQQHNWLVEQLIQWSEINSGSYNLQGLEQIHAKIIETIKTLDKVGSATIESVPLPPLEKVNDDGTTDKQPIGNALHIKNHKPNAKVKILLCGHMDTVFAIDHEFQTVTAIDDNTLNGPGLADMKGGLLVMFTALEAIEQSSLANDISWEVFINTDEEIGSISSAPILQQLAKRNDVGLIYEPSMPDGTFAGERKGSGNFSLVVRGKAAHAGREHHLGRNAIVKLAQAIDQLDNINNIAEGDDKTITLNAGRIVGGGAVNVVPDTAICHFNIRIKTKQCQQFAQQWMDKVVADINADPDYSASLHGQFTRPPKPMDERQQKLFSLLKQCGDELNINIAHVATGGCCDGNNLYDAGLPNIDTLGVRGGNIHSAKEYVLLDSLTERAKLSTLLIAKLIGVSRPC